MSNFIKRIPLPMAGLMLALAATGNLVQSYGGNYRSVFGSVSFFLLLLLLAKIIIYPSVVKEELDHPVIASVFPTLTMGTMLLSTYIKPFSANLGFIVWVLSILVHLVLMVRFTINYIVKFNIKKVFPSWFIVYVGIVVASVTAPAFGMIAIGKALFWLGFASYFILLPVVIKRVRKVDIPEPALATLAIFAAPAALCLAGYMNSFPMKSMFIVWLLVAFSQISYVLVLLSLPRLLKLGFYPSFSGLTFPLVISAISIKLTNGFLVASGRVYTWLGYIVKFEEIAAILIVSYVLIRYIAFFLVPLLGREKELGI